MMVLNNLILFPLILIKCPLICIFFNAYYPSAHFIDYCLADLGVNRAQLSHGRCSVFRSLAVSKFQMASFVDVLTSCESVINLFVLFSFAIEKHIFKNKYIRQGSSGKQMTLM